MQRGMREAAVVLLVAGVVFFTGLGGPRLWDRDETRNAGCAVEMLRGGDWVTPVFNAELRTHKPVLTYWLMMLSYAALGVSEFSARLPSAVYGIGTCLLTCFMGWRLFGQSAGMWSGISLASTLMFGVASRAATPDAPLIFWSALAMGIFVAGTTAADRPGMQLHFPSRWPVVIAMYAAMGMAVLAKGPIGLVLPTAVIGMFLLIQRLPSADFQTSTWMARLAWFARPFSPLHFLKTCWVMRPMTALVVAGAVALPWYVWVHLRTEGAWTYGFFVTHNVGRAMNAMEGHRGNFLFYPAALLVGFFPWSILWLPVVISAVKSVLNAKPEVSGPAAENRGKTTIQNFSSSAGLLLALCWVGVYLALFSVAKTKLPSYITPCYPGMALLTGSFLDRWARGEIVLSALWRRMACGTLVVVGAVVCAALPVLSAYFLPGEEILGVVGIIPLVGGCFAWYFCERQRPAHAARALAGTAVAFCTVLFSVVALRIDGHRHIEDMVAAIYADDPVESVQVGSLTSTESSWVFYCRQPIVSLADPGEALEFVSTQPTGTRRVLLITQERLEQLRAELPLDDFRQTSVPLFLEKDQLVVLSPIRSVQLTSGEAEGLPVRPLWSTRDFFRDGDSSKR